MCLLTEPTVQQINLRCLNVEQVNGALNSRGELFGIGVTSNNYWILMNSKIGIDFEWNPKTVKTGQLGDWGMDVDMQRLLVHINTQNCAIKIHLTPAGLIDFEVDILDR